MPDTVHMLLPIHPSTRCPAGVGFINGKTAMHLGAAVRGAQAKPRGSTLLRSQVLVVDRWTQRGRRSGVHPVPGTRGSTSRLAAIVAMTSHRSGGSKNWCRVGDFFQAALNGSQI